MKVIGLCRIGKDVELRYSPSGDAVATLALSFTFGKKGTDGRRPTQWVDAALWGKRAEALVPYLQKGGQIVVELSEVHNQTYESAKGGGTKMVGKVDNIELVGNRAERTLQPVNQMEEDMRPTTKAAPALVDIDSDLPF